MWKVLIKCKNKLNSKFVINSQYIPRENSKSNAIELPINKGFLYEKRRQKQREKNPTNTLPK